MTTHAKVYDPIEWMRGNDGEDPGTMSVCVILDPSPHYPDACRIICGSPANSDSDLGGFSCAPEQAVRFAETLEMAARDADGRGGGAVGRGVEPLSHQAVYDRRREGLGGTLPEASRLGRQGRQGVGRAEPRDSLT